MGERGKPWAPPLVEMSGGQVGHLLEWRQHERDGQWRAWVSWVQVTGDPPRHRRMVVSVQAESLRPLEAPEAYEDVPRTIHGNDGKIRPWAPEAPPLAQPTHSRSSRRLVATGESVSDAGADESDPA